jgi:hypothetical protein
MLTKEDEDSSCGFLCIAYAPDMNAPDPTPADLTT